MLPQSAQETPSLCGHHAGHGGGGGGTGVGPLSLQDPRWALTPAPGSGQDPAGVEGRTVPGCAKWCHGCF